MSGPPPADWQTSCKSIKNRGEYLLESGLWSDCKFIVGMEPNQQVIECHKLFLAMASPVFQAMFYGGMPEKNPITILDVQPEAFKALLEYVYFKTKVKHCATIYLIYLQIYLHRQNKFDII